MNLNWKGASIIAVGLAIGGISALSAQQQATLVRLFLGNAVVSASNPLPVAATITPSGTQDINLKQVQGAAPSATNPLWVSPATASTPWTVGGAAASGAALSGNPVRVGMSDGTNTQNWLAAIALADGVNGNNTGAVAPWLWNGTTYDRARGSTAGAFNIIRDAAGNARGMNVNANSAGLVAIDQTTDGTTNGVRSTNQYPSGATPITASATGTTGATTATLATGSSVTTYICGFSIRANATAAATGNATVTGTITGTLNFTQWTAPNASGLGITEMIFTPCVPASAVNTSIAVVSAAPGTGGVVSSTAWGYTK